MICRTLRTWIVGIALAILASTSGCGGKGGDHDSASGKPNSQDKSGASDAKPAISLTAEEFRKYEDNSGATRKYKGKVIEVTGVVKSLHRNSDGKPYITLVAGDDALGLACKTADPQPWATVVPGQKVKLKGLWPEAANAPILADVVIFEAGPSPTIGIPATQLAKEYAANPDEVTKKYNEKYLIVDGQVVDKKSPEGKEITHLYLKGDGKARVNCVISGSERKFAEPLKPGDSVKVVGKYLPLQEGDDVDLRDCFLIKPAS